MDALKGKKVLITGGAGFLGRAMVSDLVKWDLREIVVASRDEVKHAEMRKRFPQVTYMVADVRDLARMKRATYGVDVIIHAAAMKRVESCAFDPQEAVKTNVIGSQNIVEAAIDNETPLVIGVSSDKACNPVNLYGTTKATMERLFLSSNNYNLSGVPTFAVARYGNVMGSTGSAIPLFMQQRKTGRLTVTHPDMTRFMMPVEKAAELIWSAIEACAPGLYLPKELPAMKIVDMAQTIGDGCEIEIVGMRQDEKLHEIMWDHEGRQYSSDKPARWYTPEELKAWMRANYKE